MYQRSAAALLCCLLYNPASAFHPSRLRVWQRATPSVGAAGGSDSSASEELFKLQREIAEMEQELGREVPLDTGDSDEEATISIKARAAAAATFTADAATTRATSAAFYHDDGDTLEVPGSGKIEYFSLPESVLAWDSQRQVFDSAVTIPQPPSTGLPPKRTTVEFTPWIKAKPKETSGWRRNQGSIIYTCELELPLGIVLEDSADGRCNVVEVIAGGSAAAGGVVRVGDILRAFTTLGKLDYRRQKLWQQDSILFQIVGDSRKDGEVEVDDESPWRRLLAPADKEPFESVMAGLKANAQPDDDGADHPPDGNLPVILVLERSVLSMETEESEAVRLLPKVPPVERPKRPRIWSA